MWNIWNVRSVIIAGQSSYVDLLAAAWEAHLAPRISVAPTVISIFAGCGGSSLGYSMAGYRELLAVEWDDNAVQTFRLNFPDVPVYHGDIAALTVQDVLAQTGLEPGQLDVLDGSPPCQGFSTAGKRSMNDPRNGLFREYVRLLRGLKPRVFVMENVSGLVKGKMKLLFVDMLRELKASGYRVSARLMNAMYFTVPQSRQRLIFIGMREDIGIIPSYPSPERLPIAINAAVDVPNGTIGYVTAGNERHTMADRLPLRPANQPMATLIKSGNSRMMETGRIESITVHEAARFASFPDAFQWLTKAQERIGNSVPPLFMRAIAQHVRTHLLVAQPAAAR